MNAILTNNIKNQLGYIEEGYISRKWVPKTVFVSKEGVGLDKVHI